MTSVAIPAFGAGAPRETPPAPAPPRTVTFPRPQERSLENGLRVVVVERAGTPLVALTLAVTAGGSADPRTLPGLASMVAELLPKGTARHSATAIADLAEAMGSTLETEGGWDGSTADMVVRTKDLEPALRLIGEVVREPAFAADEIERLRSQRSDELQVAMTQPRFVAGAAAAKLAFGDGPYGHALGGTEASLERMTRDAIVGFHRERYRPDAAILVIAGAVRAEAGFALARAVLGDWARPAAPAAPTAPSTAAGAPAPRVVVVDKPDGAQAAVLLVRPGISRTDSDVYRGAVANAVLGGGYSARLNQEVRIKRGLSYGANSTLTLRRAPGPFAMTCQTKHVSAPEVATLFVAELRRLAKEPVPAVELVPRKASLLGNFARRLETNEGLRDYVVELALAGSPLDEANRFTAAVQAVDGEAVRSFAGSRLDAAAASLVVVGNAAEFIERLRHDFPQVELVPLERLDLEALDLRRTPQP